MALGPRGGAQVADLLRAPKPPPPPRQREACAQPGEREGETLGDGVPGADKFVDVFPGALGDAPDEAIAAPSRGAIAGISALRARTFPSVRLSSSKAPISGASASKGKSSTRHGSGRTRIAFGIVCGDCRIARAE